MLPKQLEHVTKDHLATYTIFCKYKIILFISSLVVLSLTSLKITQTFHLLLSFAKNQLFSGILKLKIAFG